MPNDPIYASQWHLDQASGVDINAVEAWDLSRSSSETVIAVVDSGLHLSQPEFAGRIYESPDDPPLSVRCRSARTNRVGSTAVP